MVCHGDFHPLNVMVDGERASVIDWTDAGLGPREADVARTLLLFHIAAIAADSAVERRCSVAGPGCRALPAHLRGGGAARSDRMRVWEVLHAVHGWAQVEMLHAGGFDGASSAQAGRCRSASATSCGGSSMPSRASDRLAGSRPRGAFPRHGHAVQHAMGVAELCTPA